MKTRWNKLKKKEIEKLIKEVFNRYGKNRIFEEEFIQYFKQKEMTPKEIDQLWSDALFFNLIKVGVWTIRNESNPLEPLTKIVFELPEEPE